jgi:hypothetical protein
MDGSLSHEPEQGGESPRRAGSSRARLDASPLRQLLSSVAVDLAASYDEGALRREQFLN